METVCLVCIVQSQPGDRPRRAAPKAFRLRERLSEAPPYRRQESVYAQLWYQDIASMRSHFRSCFGLLGPMAYR